MTEAEHQQFPGDWEALVGQGPITLHSEEHLAGIDRDVNMIRQLLRRQLRAIERAEDPMGTAFSEDEAYVRLEAGNFAAE